MTGFILTREPGPNLPMVKGTVAFAGDDPRPFMVAYGGAATNLPEIEAAAAGNGSLAGTPDRDQVIRQGGAVHAGYLSIFNILPYRSGQPSGALL